MTSASSAPGRPGQDALYPSTATWCADAPSGHVWAGLLLSAIGDGCFDAVLAPLEAVLSTLDRIEPIRIARKRKAFKTDLDQNNQLNLRVELLVAYKLANANVPFEFGGDGQPDIRCTTSSGATLWLEVTTRDRDDVVALHDDIETALVGSDVIVHLRIPARRLIIPELDRTAMRERVYLAAQTLGAGDTVNVTLPEIEGSALCSSAIAPPGPLHVFIDIGPALGDHMASVEVELKNVLANKAQQAKRGQWMSSTLLIVDGSRLGLSWLRPEAVWAGTLTTLDLDWTNLPFVGVLICFSSLDSLRLVGAWILRPDCSATDRTAVEELVAGLGIGPLGPPDD